MTELKFSVPAWFWRLPLALVFIYAAAEKIISPADFALTIHNYRLLPLWAIGPLALVLPWLELWAGLAVLKKGEWGRAAALILGLLLIVFMLAVSFNLARGLDFECGCFGPGGRRAGLTLLGQDALLLVCALMTFFRGEKRKGPA